MNMDGSPQCRALPPVPVLEAKASAYPLVFKGMPGCSLHRYSPRRLLTILVEWLRGPVVHEAVA
jgi:hypothetical protein